MAKHIFTGVGAPNFIPEDVGHHYVDTLTKDAYLSVGKTTTSDWVIAAGTSVANGVVINQMDGSETNLSPSVAAVKAYILGLIDSIVANQIVVEYVTLDATHITSKQFTLSNIPSNASDVTLDLIGASAQVLGEDYAVTDDVISWDGLSLQDILSIGDKIRVQYSKSNTV